MISRIDNISAIIRKDFALLDQYNFDLRSSDRR